MTCSTAQRKPFVPATLAAGERFGKYKGESEKAVRKAEVRPDRALEKIKQAWMRLLELYEVSERIDNRPNSNDRRDILCLEAETHYLIASGFVENINYPAKAVERFTILFDELGVQEHMSEYLMHFLNALVNKGRASRYVLDTRSWPFEPHFLGCGLSGKRLVIHGDCGDLIGCEMVSGKLIVNGNVGDNLGNHMEGGTIVVNGDLVTNECFVYGMKGGEVHINGDMILGRWTRDTSVENIQRGRIYHKRKLIVDK
jgi:hypothetical protein